MKYIDEYRNKHIGKAGVVIGGGPSILHLLSEQFNFDQLHSIGIIVGTNRAYHLMNPNYLWFSDSNFWRTFKEEILATDSIKFFPAEYQQQELGGVDDPQATPVLVERTYRTGDQLVPRVEHGRLLITGGSGVCGLRVAMYLGLNPIYLLGMDCQPDTTGKQHFHDAYDDKPWTLATPAWYDRCYQVFRSTIERAELEGYTIYSCSQFSRLNDVISYKNIVDVLKST